MRFSDDDFTEICRRNPDCHIEQEANGDIIIMAPSGGETSRRNAGITAELSLWARTNGGVVLDSSGGFRLPNRALRSPDASWFSTANWESAPLAEREGFPNLVPDFVIELVSPSDTLSKQTAKMEEYAANGVRLGWLIIPAAREIHVYRPHQSEPEVHVAPLTLEADPGVLPDFKLVLAVLW